MMKKHKVLLFCIFCLLVCAFAGPGKAKANTSGWEITRDWAGDGIIAIDSAVKYPGTDSSVKIVNNSYNHVYAQKRFEVKPNTIYIATAWVRTEGYERNPKDSSDSGACIGFPNSYYCSECYFGTEWKKLEYVFKTNAETSVDFALWNGNFGSTCKGTAYFSDFNIQEYYAYLSATEGYSVFYNEAEAALAASVTGSMESNYAVVPPLFDFFGYDGLYRVAYCDSDYVYIDTLDENLKKSDTLKIKKELELVGNIISDAAGNYYIVYGHNDEECLGNVVVISVVKYSKKGKKLGSVDYTGWHRNWNENELDFGVRDPFTCNCDVIIDNNGVLAVHYAGLMYNTHQSSDVIYIDTEKMEDLDIIAPYTSHSFGQRVISTSDGGYLISNVGDAFDRGITLTRIYKDASGDWKREAFVPFHFRTGTYYQKTYAKVAGIAELTNGYAIAGTSVKTLSCKVPETNDKDDLESRNLFMQVVKKDFTEKDSCQKEVQVLKGSTRTAIETEYYDPSAKDTYHGCMPEDKDYGVLWLTNYTGLEYASAPKMLQIDSKRLLILWEKNVRLSEENENAHRYITTYYCIVSKDGEFLQKPTEIPGFRLSEQIEPVFKNGCVYMATTANLSGAYGVEPDDKGVYCINKLEIPDIKYIPSKAAAVKELRATELYKDQATLSWTDNGDPDSYIIYRKSTKTGRYKKIGTTTCKYYTDKTKLTQGKTYYYKVKAVYTSLGKTKTCSAVSFSPVEIKWDNTLSYTGVVNVSVDRTVKYKKAKYSIKIDNTGYECGFAEKSFEVEPDTDYVVTVMAKCDGYELMPGKQYNSGAGIGFPEEYSLANTYSSEWTKLSFEFNSGKKTEIKIALWNGTFGADCAGTAYFSDFKLKKK